MQWLGFWLRCVLPLRGGTGGELFAFVVLLLLLSTPKMAFAELPGQRELLVSLAPMDPATQDQLLAAHNLVRLDGTPRLLSRGWVRVKSEGSLPLSEVLLSLLASPLVLDAWPNVPILGVSSGDPFFERQWNLPAMGASDAWSWQADAEGLVVALLDTGLSPGLDLMGSLVLSGEDFVEWDADPRDDHQHGTFMASILASEVDNGWGIAGVAPRVTFLPVKILDHQMRGTLAALLEGLYYAAESGAQVVNLSLAFAPGVYPGPALDEALLELQQQGILVFAAAGNDGLATVSYPAAHPSVIAVGASQPQGNFAGLERATYSNYGTALDLLVPGGIWADINGDGWLDGILGETFDHKTPEEYGVWVTAGTSAATAQASGAAALLLAAGVPSDSVRHLLESTAQDLAIVGFDAQTGIGHLQLNEAMEAWQSGGISLPVSSTTSVQQSQETQVVISFPAMISVWHETVATVTVQDASGHGLPRMWVSGHFAGASSRGQTLRTNS